MDSDKIDDLKNKLGLDTIPLGSPERGVVLAWTSALARSFAPGEGWTILGDTTLPVAPGEAMHKWIFGSGPGRFTLSVFVSSAGPEVARQRLVTLATDNMRPDVPYVPGPADLGDVSAIFAVPPDFAHLVWAYGNVCVSIEVRQAPGADVTAMARAVQAKLAQNVVPHLDAAAPHVDRVDLSAPQVHVDEPLSIQVRMKPNEPEHELLVDIYQRDARVRILGGIDLTTRLTAGTPGHWELKMLVADRSTLLSAWAPAAFDVVPAT
jgi:hypothetical protein